MKKRIITIAGALGGGKSSTAKLVASELGYRHFSSGDLFRQVARERGVSIEEINKVAELEISIDHDVDERLRLLGNEDDLVIDSRLAYHWIPGSFKVYLDLDLETAAARIFKQLQSEGRTSQKADSIEELMAATASRKENERRRYERLYQLDVTDLSPFDLVIDTGKHDLPTVATNVIDAYHTFLGR